MENVHFNEKGIDTEITWLLKTLTDSANCAFESYKKTKKYRYKKNKSWWNEDLSSAKSILTRTFNAWKQTKFKKDDTCPQYFQYKLARKNFRNAIKISQNKTLTNRYVQLDKLKHTHSTKFWKTIKSMKTSNSKVLHINDKINEQEIASEFKNHFDKLLNTPQISIIQSELPAKDDSVINHDMLFSTTVIKSAIKHLHANKSSDPFLIKSEHFTTISNENLNLWLTSFFNHILNSGKVPEILSTSLIIPLVKSYKKSLSSSDNYRGISLTPILTKILEILLLQKSEIFTETSPSQFGFKKNSSTLHAEFIITETIRYYNQNNTPIYICSLDAQKAF